MLNQWNAATFNHPLAKDMWSLRDKSGVDLVDSFPDKPALRDQCLNKGGKPGEQFQFGKTLKAVVMLTAGAYDLVEKHIEECRAKVIVFFSTDSRIDLTFIQDQDYEEAPSFPLGAVANHNVLHLEGPHDNESQIFHDLQTLKTSASIKLNCPATPERSLSKRAFIVGLSFQS